MAKVLITGGTGMIGSRLTQQLRSAGHQVRLLSRNPQGVAETYSWNPQDGTMDTRALNDIDTIVHLAGAGIADKAWTSTRKQEIVDSRVKTSELLLEHCKKEGIRLKQFISASAIGWYPLIISPNRYDELSPPGKGFLADVCKQWEKAAESFESVADSVSIVRIGLVLAKGEGALKQIELPVKYYCAAGLGSGKQAMSWIHVEDVGNIFTHILEHRLAGIYNAVGPETTSNQEFMQTLADVMERPLVLPNVPEFALRMALGEKADLILKGVMLSSKKIQATGFSFQYPTLNTALMNIYG